MESLEALYLQDLGVLLKDLAAEAARCAAQERAAGSTDGFQAGRSMALVEVMSLMLSQANAFGIPAEQLSLGGIDPERDFLG